MPDALDDKPLFDWASEVARLERRIGSAANRATPDPWVVVEAEYSLDLIDMEIRSRGVVTCPSQAGEQLKLIHWRGRIAAALQRLQPSD